MKGNCTYYVVILGGIIVTMIYNSVADILRSIGDSRTPLAAFAAGAKLRMMFTCGLDMLGMSVSTFCSQNIGAQKKERVSRGVKCGIFLVLCGCHHLYLSGWTDNGFLESFSGRRKENWGKCAVVWRKWEEIDDEIYLVSFAQCAIIIRQTRVTVQRMLSL